MGLKQSASVLALAAAGMLTCQADAQVANTSPSNVNVLNLLAPYLTLNTTAAGQATLTRNLSQAIATNNGANLQTQSLAISDKNLLGATSTSVTLANGTSVNYGPGANLGGGLPILATPAGSTVAPSQPVGGLGAVLGAAFVTGVSPNNGAPALGATVTLLNNAYTHFTSLDLGVAKNYFADGAASNATGAAATSTPAVAPAGYVLPRANGLPNTTNSVYDLAYGVTNTGTGQDVYGSSRPVQVAPNSINQFDPTALAGLSTNPSFPSGHTTYAYTDSILIGMLVPQDYQNMLLRASAYANSRIALGVHYPLDIIGSRALASYDLAQALTNPNYMNGTATTVPGGGANVVNLQANFIAAGAQITPYLTTAATQAGCGATIAACATSAVNTANDPYVPSTANQALYDQRLTYGLPTLGFVEAPREAAPASGPDASILLAPLFGGSTTAAQAIAPTGGIYANLSTTTINQIIVNTETNALAAFYGSSLSYWTRLDLYAAAGFFSNVTGTLSLQPTDVVSTNVAIGSDGTLSADGTVSGTTAVGSGGTLAGSGTVAAVNVGAGGVLAPGSLAAQAAMNGGTPNVTGARLSVNGALTLSPGATLAIFATPTQSTSVTTTGAANVGGASVKVRLAGGPFTPGASYTIVTANGGISGTFADASTSLPFLAAQLTYSAKNVVVSLAPDGRALLSAAVTGNEVTVAGALVAASRSNTDSPILKSVLNLSSIAEARAAFDALSGEGIAATQNLANRSAQMFSDAITDQTTFYGSGGGNAITLTDAPPAFVALAPTHQTPGQQPIHELADLPSASHQPVMPAAPDRTWRAWASGFGGVEDIHGNGTAGSAAQDNTIYGGTLGVDYQLTPNYLVGVALGGSDGAFQVPGRTTSGSTTGGHVAFYDLATFGKFYGASSNSFSYFTNRTTRFVGGFGGLASETERGDFDSHEFRSRLEFGRHMDGVPGFGTVTPFIALEIAELRANGFGETSVTGPGLFRLNVSGQSAADVPGFIGLRVQNAMPLGGMAFVPSLQVAYVHDFAPYRSQIGALTDLPGATFLVDGARAARDAAQVKAGGEVRIGTNSALFANFDGEFSGASQLYAGKGGFRWVW